MMEEDQLNDAQNADRTLVAQTYYPFGDRATSIRVRALELAGQSDGDPTQVVDRAHAYASFISG